MPRCPLDLSESSNDHRPDSRDEVEESTDPCRLLSEINEPFCFWYPNSINQPAAPWSSENTILVWDFVFKNMRVAIVSKNAAQKFSVPFWYCF